MNSGLDLLGFAVIQDNLLLLQGLGIYALTRYTKDMKTALRASLAFIGAMVTASLLLWTVEGWLPSLFGLDMPFVLLLGTASALFWQKILGGRQWLPTFDQSLTAGLTNSALIGLLLVMLEREVSGVSLVSQSISYSLGFGLALLILAGIRERLALAPIPKPLQGIPILLITAGLLGVALLGFRF